MNEATIIKSTTEGAVVASSQADTETVYMAEEVDTLEQAKRSIKDDTKNILRQLVGNTLQFVEAELANLIAQGMIGSFRTLTQGQMFTGDFVPDRVQVVVGTDQQVKEVEVG